MPFLAPLLPAALSAGASAAAGYGVNALLQGIQPKAPTTVNPLETQAGQALTQQNTANTDQQQALVNALAAQGGIQNQSQVYNQLQQLAQGQGPAAELAQSQLNQATAQNVAQQAALQASQRGAGANAGLLARNAALAGTNAQQQAAGQAATLKAQQSLGALGQLGGLASQQVAQQQGALGQLGGLTQQQEQILNQASLGQQGIQANIYGSQVAGQKPITEMLGKGLSGAISGVGSGLPGLFSAAGGGSAAGGALLGAGGGSAAGGASAAALFAAKGGVVPPQQGGPEVARKENYKGKSKFGRMMMAEGGKVHNMRGGGHVPGKPKVGGAVDSYANDNVEAVLSPGEIVLPRSVTKSAKPAEAAAKFVAALKNKKGK